MSNEIPTIEDYNFTIVVKKYRNGKLEHKTFTSPNATNALNEFEGLYLKEAKHLLFHTSQKGEIYTEITNYNKQTITHKILITSGVNTHAPMYPITATSENNNLYF